MKLDSNTYQQHVINTYPYLYIDNLPDNLVKLITSIPPGKLPIKITHEGKLKTLKTLETNPKHLELLIKLYHPKLQISKSKFIILENIFDYINCGEIIYSTLLIN